MNRNEIQKRFIHCQSELDSISVLLNRARQTDITDFADYCESLKEAAHRSEKLACFVRDLVVTTTFCDKKLFLDDVGEVQGITIERLPSWYRIIIPALLPKKKPSQNCSFIVDPLSRAMEVYARKNSLQKLEKCVMCFRHVYTSDLPERAVRDHDNIEIKQVQDIIADKLISDDTGLRCTNLATSARGEFNHTEIFVMLPEALPEWLNNYPIETTEEEV